MGAEEDRAWEGVKRQNSAAATWEQEADHFYPKQFPPWSSFSHLPAAGTAGNCA